MVGEGRVGEKQRGGEEMKAEERSLGTYIINVENLTRLFRLSLNLNIIFVGVCTYFLWHKHLTSKSWYLTSKEVSPLWDVFILNW